MLSHRLLMSALLIPTTIGLFAWDHRLSPNAPVLFMLVMLLAMRCVWELVTLARVAGFQPKLALCFVSVGSLLAAVWWPHLASEFFLGDSGLLIVVHEPSKSLWFGMFGLIVVVLFFNAVFRFPLTVQNEDVRGREIGTLGIELLIVVYVGLLLAMTSQLRWLENGTSGYFALGALVVATKMGDVGAYTFGRLIGGAKMTPKLSPGKTWAGGVGHLVTAGLCATAWLCWLGPKISTDWLPWNFGPAAIFGVVVGFAGLVGDLAESLIKRDVGVKDAPVLLPGFGGLLDLMDSILLAGPVAYGMWCLLR